jgi:hypothetical protein
MGSNTITEQKLPYEQAAEHKTISLTGWVCKSCGRFYGTGESTARYCCAPDLPCGTEGCKGRADKPYIHCRQCRGTNDLKKWLSLPEVPWDGETPLCLFDDDQYFFSIEDLDDYLEENKMEIEDVQVVICEKADKPYFSITDFLCDYMPEDEDVDDAEEIDKIVNDWIRDRVMETWEGSKTRPTVASLRGTSVT